MKNVSRILLGVSVVAVLAFFSACKQPADAAKAPAVKPSLNLANSDIDAALRAAIGNVSGNGLANVGGTYTVTGDVTIPDTITIGTVSGYKVTSVVVQKKSDSKPVDKLTSENKGGRWIVKGPVKSATPADNVWNVVFTVEKEGKAQQHVISVTNARVATPPAPATLGLAENLILDALKTSINTNSPAAVDFTKNPIEVSNDVKVSKKLTIGTEADVNVTVTVLKTGTTVAPTGVVISEEGGNKHKIAVPQKDAAVEANNLWTVVFALEKGGKTQTYRVNVKNVKN